MANGKKFSIDFQQAQEIENTTQILIQSEGWPVQKATLEQIGRALIKGNIVSSITGNYPKMSVGFAENIVGDGSATAEEFSFRPTAGVNRNTLNDGAARIHSIKGRSVVANQKAIVGINTTTRNGITVTNDGVKSTVVGMAEAFTNISLATASIAANHKCLLGGCPSNGSASTFYFSDGLGNIDYGQGVIFTTTEAHSDTWMNFTVAQGTTVDFVIYPVLYDLTQMFGAGNEPETVEEYYQRNPIGINEDEYNKGKLVNLVPKAIKTTGFNQFNGRYAKVLGGLQYYLGGNYTSIGFATEEDGTTEAITTPTSSEVAGGSAPADRLYTPSQNGYIYATGENICISLYWPTEYGNLYGTYQPYKPFERDLSGVNKYFPNGMRSAGNVADEIRFNSSTQKWEAVQKIGVLDLGTLGWNRQPDTGIFFTEPIANMQTTQGYTQRVDGCCSIYPASGVTSINVSMWDKSFLREINRIYIKDSAYNDTITFREGMVGVLFNYPLAEPIVTEITENVNFDYDVSDYGTEELIVAEGVESAPLSASIEYSPNVLAVLKNAPGIANDVDMLKSQLSVLTAQLATLTLNNN